MTTHTANNNDYISPDPAPTPFERQWQQLWQDIELAGGRYQYVQQQLVSQGFMVERQPVDNMSPKERDRYKKALKKEAAEEKVSKKLLGKHTKRITWFTLVVMYIGRTIPVSISGT
ncbi:hypothetical protein ACOBWA_07330 [Psychrobacter sp. ER1]|uniref:hypothetical protein n=1 Tax=Psychrobacter sp. ER1 TaxID=3406645 RepID=UPI003B429006